MVHLSVTISITRRNFGRYDNVKTCHRSETYPMWPRLNLAIQTVARTVRERPYLTQSIDDVVPRQYTLIHKMHKEVLQTLSCHLDLNKTLAQRN